MPEISTGMIIVVTGVSLFGGIFSLLFLAKVLTPEGVRISTKVKSEKRIEPKKVKKTFENILSELSALENDLYKKIPIPYEKIRTNVLGNLTYVKAFISSLNLRYKEELPQTKYKILYNIKKIEPYLNQLGIRDPIYRLRTFYDKVKNSLEKI